MPVENRNPFGLTPSGTPAMSYWSSSLHLFPAVPASRLHELHLAIAPALSSSPSTPSYHGFVLRFIVASARGHERPML